MRADVEFQIRHTNTGPLGETTHTTAVAHLTIEDAELLLVDLANAIECAKVAKHSEAERPGIYGGSVQIWTFT